MRCLKVILRGTLVIILMFYTSSSYGEGIRVTGRVINSLFPNMKIQSIKVLLVIEDMNKQVTMVEAGYDEKTAEYDKLLSLDYLNHDFEIKALSENYVQIQPTAFRPEKHGKYENAVLVKHKKNFAEDLFITSINHSENREYEKALININKAINLAPQEKHFQQKLSIVRAMVLNGTMKTESYEKISEDFNSNEKFQKLSAIFQQKIYCGLGSVIGKAKNNDFARENFGQAMKNLDRAIELQPYDARPYQAKHLQQFKNGYCWGALMTAISFLEKKEGHNENTVKTFLADAITYFEKLTGFPMSTEDEYESEIKKNEQYVELMSKLYKELQNIEYMFKHAPGQQNERLRSAMSLFQRLLG